jgi:hypothetical protein
MSQRYALVVHLLCKFHTHDAHAVPQEWRSCRALIPTADGV